MKNRQTAKAIGDLVFKRQTKARKATELPEEQFSRQCDMK